MPFDRRSLEWDLTSLPVSADLLVYSEAKWETIVKSGSRFARVLTEEVPGSSAEAHEPPPLVEHATLTGA